MVGLTPNQAAVVIVVEMKGVHELLTTSDCLSFPVFEQASTEASVISQVFRNIFLDTIPTTAEHLR